MAIKRTYRVFVEDYLGLRAEHLVDAYYADTAREIEEARGYTVLSVT